MTAVCSVCVCRLLVDQVKPPGVGFPGVGGGKLNIKQIYLATDTDFELTFDVELWCRVAVARS